MHPPKKKQKKKQQQQKNKQTNKQKHTKKPTTKLGGYFIVAWVQLVKKNDVNRKTTQSQGTCHAPF